MRRGKNGEEKARKEGTGKGAEKIGVKEEKIEVKEERIEVKEERIGEVIEGKIGEVSIEEMIGGVSIEGVRVEGMTLLI